MGSSQRRPPRLIRQQSKNMFYRPATRIELYDDHLILDAQQRQSPIRPGWGPRVDDSKLPAYLVNYYTDINAEKPTGVWEVQRLKNHEQHPQGDSPREIVALYAYIEPSGTLHISIQSNFLDGTGNSFEYTEELTYCGKCIVWWDSSKKPVYTTEQEE